MATTTHGYPLTIDFNFLEDLSIQAGNQAQFHLIFIFKFQVDLFKKFFLF
jgi:hypothetical protein